MAKGKDDKRGQGGKGGKGKKDPLRKRIEALVDRALRRRDRKRKKRNKGKGGS